MKISHNAPHSIWRLDSISCDTHFWKVVIEFDFELHLIHLALYIIEEVEWTRLHYMELSKFA